MKLVTTLLLAGTLTVRAAVTMSLTASVRHSGRGATLTFTGTLTNTGATDVCLNDAAFALTGGAGTPLLPGTDAFFSNVPGILLPGESYTGELFTVALSTDAPSGDYAGTMTLKGGADQLAMDSLASSGFTVRSPDVSVAATDASASEFGPEAGEFTISRSGPADLALEVSVTLTGSAVNGVAYQTVAPVVVIPPGAASGTVSIAPLPDNLAQGDRTVTLSVQTSPSYNTAAASTAAVTIHDKPADAWRLEKFGAGANTPAAADAADWNADGIENQMAYALGLDPVGFDLSKLPVASVAGGYYQLSWLPNPVAVDMITTAEASTDLTNWSAAAMEAVPGAAGVKIYRYQIPFSGAGRVYLRLRAVRSGG